MLLVVSCIFPFPLRLKIIKKLEAKFNLSELKVGLDKLAVKTWYLCCWHFLVGVNYMSLKCGKRHRYLCY